MAQSGAPARGPIADRAVRNLLNLKLSGSSSRTLNLLAVWERERDGAEHRAAPFFRHAGLNRSLIVKHRLRHGEHELFAEPRTVATKVILPINIRDLRLGGRAFFINQRGYAQVLEELDGDLPPDDRDMLQILDRLPSLDPFLMRERLRRSGLAPARCYFDITEADSRRMFDFTRREITPLIGITFDDLDVGANEKTAKLAQKILNNAADSELEPLRRGLGLDRLSFQEGIFCWKGFIYYKWSLMELAPTVRPVSLEIAQVRPTGPATEEERQFIVAARTRLSRAIAHTCETVRDTLKVYDDAFGELTNDGKPNAFRDFLLEAPRLFQELGERLGAVQHILSFWRFRFPEGVRSSIGAEELFELLGDFEHSLGSPAAARAAA